MPEIVVVGSHKARPGREQELAEALIGLVEPTHGERGCLLYALHRGVDDPTRLTFIERWASRAELDAHLASSHVKAFARRSDELLAEPPELVVYEPIPAGEPGKGALAAS
jgi:quinol monooxygenase YgiN